ncbi:MAG TPA: dTDP-4-dehydrorhamnose 3,5-epimerase [Candidatus Binatia bacterium]
MICRSRKLDIPDLVLLEAQRIADPRGSFMEMYKRSEFSQVGISEHFVQDNYSRSRRHVLRGLHYQKAPKAQAKLVTVLRGEIFDVAVDIRTGSPTYGRWTSVVLSSENPAMVYVPVGFAHGFCVLSEEADVLYKVSEEYAPEFDRGIVWSDPDVGIRWPLTEPVISVKDARLPQLKDADNDFVYDEKR